MRKKDMEVDRTKEIRNYRWNRYMQKRWSTSSKCNLEFKKIPNKSCKKPFMKEEYMNELRLIAFLSF